LPGTQEHHGLIKHILRTAVEKELFQASLFKLLDTQVSQDFVPQSSTLPHMPGSDNTPPANTHPATAHITLRWLTPLRLQQHAMRASVHARDAPASMA